MKSSLDERASTTCQKKSLVPLAPTNLTATLSGSSVSLSWTAGDSNTDGNSYVYGAWGDVPFRYNNAF